MLRGAARHGAPLAAVAHVLGFDGLAAALAPEPMPVYAPSLNVAGRLAPE
jgi:hypothetical protein